MNKTSKVCVAATLALGTLIGVTVVENSAPTSKQAQAAITPYYTYNGYIGNNANFILDKNFINAIKYDNVKFNGIKLAKTKEADSGIFYYQNAKKTLGIWFVVDHNRVVEVTVGHTPYKTSK
ncbi:TPA: hypothetical protein ACRUCH_000155 [Staphylococcus aureus]